MALLSCGKQIWTTYYILCNVLLSDYPFMPQFTKWLLGKTAIALLHNMAETVGLQTLVFKDKVPILQLVTTHTLITSGIRELVHLVQFFLSPGSGFLNLILRALQPSLKLLVTLLGGTTHILLRSMRVSFTSFKQKLAALQTISQFYRSHLSINSFHKAGRIF